jgi:TPR repeat protein
VYERSAITDWIATGTGNSPKTNEPMGPTLLPAPQVKSMIRGMVKSGALTGDKAEAWEAQLAEEELVRATRERAEGGDAEAMFSLGRWSFKGSKGLRNDKAEAFRWFQRCADADDQDGLAGLGFCYLGGWGVGKNTTLGMAYMGVAAERGSGLGCYLLGNSFAKGLYDLPKDAKQATKWLRKMQAAWTESASKASASAKEGAAAWLREHATD